MGETMDIKKELCGYCNQLLVPGDEVRDKPRVILDKKSGKMAHKGCITNHKEEKDLIFYINMTAASIGEVFALTPTLVELRNLYKTSQINLITIYPELFKHFPYVDSVIQNLTGLTDKEFPDADIYLIPFQNNPVLPHPWLCHLVDSISIMTLRRTLDNKHYVLPYAKEDSESMSLKCFNEKNFRVDSSKFIIVHPHKTGWDTRSWPRNLWEELINKIRYNYPDYDIVAIGGERRGVEINGFLEYENVIDLYDQLTLLETLALIDHPNAKLLVCPDSAPMHMAGCTKIPVVAFCSVIHSRYRLPWRDGVQGKGFYVIDSKGCSCTVGMKPFCKPYSTQACHKGYEQPLKCMPTVEEVYAKVQQLLK
jgi:ADP-heptose:LPS heptosyltransferase